MLNPPLNPYETIMRLNCNTSSLDLLALTASKKEFKVTTLFRSGIKVITFIPTNSTCYYTVTKCYDKHGSYMYEYVKYADKNHIADTIHNIIRRGNGCIIEGV